MRACSATLVVSRRPAVGTVSTSVVGANRASVTGRWHSEHHAADPGTLAPHSQVVVTRGPSTSVRVLLRGKARTCPGSRCHDGAVLLTLTSTAPDATSLGFLLHKHPDRVQSFRQAVGTAHVFYPEADDERCTAALLLEVDPVALVRGRRPGDAGALSQYVNDRPYAASSMLAVALGSVFRTALKGRCTARPELAEQPLPLTVRVPSLPARGGPDAVRRAFEPLGWAVEVAQPDLDPQVPRWGPARHLDVTLTGTLTVAAALSHLYVLLPALDGTKHYWVSTDEVDKLVRAGGAWLATHPERDLLTRRYLAHRRELVSDALDRFAELDDRPAPDDVPDEDVAAQAERREPLVAHRVRAVVQALDDVGAHRVVDLGCGEGRLLRELVRHARFSELVGVDVSARDLERAARRLRLERMGDRQRERISLRQGSATYRDRGLEGYDAVVLMEVVEHVDVERLPALERAVFGAARPGAVVVTTPNVEHNVVYGLADGSLRHPDHRFEWTRDEFSQWASRVAASHGYDVELRGVGEEHPEHGAPTQLALFRRTEVTA